MTLNEFSLCTTRTQNRNAWSAGTTAIVRSARLGHELVLEDRVLMDTQLLAINTDSFVSSYKTTFNIGLSASQEQIAATCRLHLC